MEKREKLFPGNELDWHRAGLWRRLSCLICTRTDTMKENGKCSIFQVIQMLLKGIRLDPRIFYTVPRWYTNSHLLLQIKLHILVYEVPTFSTYIQIQWRSRARTPWTGHTPTYLAIPNTFLVHIAGHFLLKNMQAFSEHSLIWKNTWVYYLQH